MKSKFYLWPPTRRQVYLAALFSVFILTVALVYICQEYSDLKSEYRQMREQYAQLLTNITIHVNAKPAPPANLR